MLGSQVPERLHLVLGSGTAVLFSPPVTVLVQRLLRNARKRKKTKTRIWLSQADTAHVLK